MTITPIQIAPSQFITSTVASYYTSTQIKTRIDKVTLSNGDTANHVVTAYLVPNGGSPAASTAIIPRRSISAGVVYHCPELIGHVLGPGDSLQFVADANDVVVMAAAGVTISP